MRSIYEQVKIIKASKKIGLMTHVVAGYPSLKATEELVIGMERAGVDFVEVQIPFSDPLADGPVIMRANDHALENAVTTEDVFELVRRLVTKVEIPLLLMGYYNTVFRYGVERFCNVAHEAGAQDLIIPDIPLDEEANEHFIRYCRANNLTGIRVLSPTSTSSRIRANIPFSRNFIYCTAVSGTTGARDRLNPQTRQFLQKMRRFTKLPLVVGFGISRPMHIRSLIGYADVAVVGSAVIQVIEENGIKAAIPYIQTLVEAGM